MKSTFLESVKYVDALTQILVPVDMAPSQGKNRQAIKLPNFSNFVEATEKEIAALNIAESHQKSALIHELQSQNSNLLKRIHHLEQELTECRNVNNEHQERSQTAISLLNQKTQELVDSQAQVKQLIASVETLRSQLQISQEKVDNQAQEYNLTQERYQQQSQQLEQTENTCQELRTRLNRQQRYTLQLKVALEKCLDSSFSRHKSEEDCEYQSVYPQQQPIKSWSEQPVTTPSAANTWVDSISSAPQFTPVKRVSSDLEAKSEDSALLDNRPMTDYEPEAELWQDLTNLLAAVETPLNDDLDEVDNQEQLQLPKSTQQAHSSDVPIDSNCPSPVILSSQPLKKRKSLAAIELPSFLPKSASDNS